MKEIISELKEDEAKKIFGGDLHVIYVIDGEGNITCKAIHV